MAKNEPNPQRLWISPNAADSVKTFEATLGRLPNFNITLRLVNGLPFVQINPLLHRVDIVNMNLFPFISIFVLTLFLLMSRFETLAAIQIVQLLALLLVLVWLAFISLVRHFVQRNYEFVHQINSILQSSPTYKSRETYINDNRHYDLSGIMLLFIIIFVNVFSVPIVILTYYLGIGPIQMAAEQIFHLHTNKCLFFLDIVLLFAVLLFVLCREGFVIVFIGVNLFSRIDTELLSLNSHSLPNTEFVCFR